MKKGIIVLLIAVLVSGFAFAKLSGNAGVRFDADLTDKAFITSNPASLDFSFTFTSDEIKIDSSEDEIHVEVAASAKFILGKYKGGIYGVGILADADTSDRGIGIVASIDTAKIVGKNWYVSVLGTQSAYDYAKAAVLQYNDRTKSDDFGNEYADDDWQASTYKPGYANVPGVTVGYADFTVSAGFDYVDELFIASASVETPEFAFSDDAVKVQAAVEANRLAVDGKDVKVAYNVLGASAKATVAVQDITIGVATDMGLEKIGAELEGEKDEDTEFNIDARVDFKYNFVDASIYTYAGKAGLAYGKPLYNAYQDFYLEAKAAFDLNAFELPLKVTVSAKNITNSEAFIGGVIKKAGIVPKVKVEFAKDAITAAASFEINTEDKEWNSLVYGTYAFEKFTAGAGVKVAGATELKNVKLGAFAESDKLVKGATFGLSYGLDNSNTYKKGGKNSLDNAKFSSDFKADPVDAGDVLAYCKIAF